MIEKLRKLQERAYRFDAITTNDDIGSWLCELCEIAIDQEKRLRAMEKANEETD